MLSEKTEQLEQSTRELASAKRELSEEVAVRQAHEATESRLAEFVENVSQVTKNAVGDVKLLHTILEEALSGEKQHQKKLKNVKDDMQRSLTTIYNESDTLHTDIRKSLEDLATQITSMAKDTHTQLSQAHQLLANTHEDMDKTQARNLQNTLSQGFKSVDTFLNSLQKTRQEICSNLSVGLESIGSQCNALAENACSKLGTIEKSLDTSLGDLQKETTEILYSAEKRIRDSFLDFEAIKTNFSDHYSELQNFVTECRSDLKDQFEQELEEVNAEHENLLELVVKTIKDAHNSRTSSLRSIMSHFRDKTNAIEDRISDTSNDHRAAMESWSTELFDANEKYMGKSKIQVAERFKETRARESSNLKQVEASIRTEVSNGINGVITHQKSQLDTQTKQLSVVMTQAQELCAEQEATFNDQVTQFAASVRAAQQPVLQSLEHVQAHTKTCASAVTDTAIQQAGAHLADRHKAVEHHIGGTRELVDHIDADRSCFYGETGASSRKRLRGLEYYDEMETVTSQCPKRTKAREDIISDLQSTQVQAQAQ